MLFSDISQGTLKLLWFKGHFYEGIISILFAFSRIYKKVKDNLGLLYIWFTWTQFIYLEDLLL